MSEYLSDIIFSNQDRNLDLVARDDTGTVIDLTSHALRADIKRDSTSVSSVKSYASGGSGITILVAASGTYRIAIDAADLTSLTEDGVVFVQSKYYSGGSPTGDGTGFNEYRLRFRTGAANP